MTDGRLVLFLLFFLIFATIVGDCFPAVNQNNIIMDRKILSRAAALVAVLVVAGFSVFGIFRHERRQTEVITRLSEEIRVMSHKLNGIAGGPEWPEDTFNYLAIGNSLTLHGITSFWWDNRGMAASKTEKDYFHIVSRQLGDRIGKVFSVPYNFSMWEVQAHDRDELAVAFREAARYDRRILVEETIVGREIECAVLGGGEMPVQASGVGEILAAADFYDYEAKYFNAESKTVVDPELPGDSAERVREAAVRIFNAVDGYGLSRVDFFVTAEGEVVFNEINTMPGFTAISMYPMLWEARGLGKKELIQTVIDLGFAREN